MTRPWASLKSQLTHGFYNAPRQITRIESSRTRAWFKCFSRASFSAHRASISLGDTEGFISCNARMRTISPVKSSLMATSDFSIKGRARCRNL